MQDAALHRAAFLLGGGRSGGADAFGFSRAPLGGVAFLLAAPVSFGLFADQNAAVEFDLARTSALPLELVIQADADRVALAEGRDSMDVARLPAFAVALERQAGLR